MALDTNIALGVKPIEQPNMLAQMGQMMQMRQMQQGFESENALRDFYAQGGDLSTVEGRRQLMSRAPAAGMKLIGQQSEIRARDVGTLGKEYENARVGLNGVTDEAGYYNWVLSSFNNPYISAHQTQMGITPEKALANARATVAKEGLSTALAKSAMGIEKYIPLDLQLKNSTQNAQIAAASGNRNATVNEQRFGIEQADRAEADRLLGRPSATPFTPPMTGRGGGGGGAPFALPMTSGGAPSTGGGVPNALPAIVGATPAAPAPTNMLVPGAQAPATAPVTPVAPAAAPTAAPVTATAPVTAAAPVDAMNARIQDINAEIARLRPYMGNPKIAANVQQLNIERAQLVTAAKQDAPTLTEVDDPNVPGQKLKIDARVYKQGTGLGAPGVFGVSRTERLTPAQQLKVKKEMALDFKAVDKTIAETNELLKSIDAVRNSDLEAVAGPFDVLTKTVKNDSLLAETRFASLKGKVTAIAKAASTMTGAIGSIANQEWQILANQIAVLDLKNGKDANLEQIEQLERQAMSIANRMRAGFERQYGEHLEELGPQYKEIPDVTYKMGSEGFTKSGQKRPAKSSATPASTGNIADNAGVAKVIEFGSLK